jgi:hypothetical protein
VNVVTQRFGGVVLLSYLCKMFIRAVQKKDKSKSKSYTYYRLTHSYRIGNKTRQSVLLNLGKLESISKSDHKALANRIEEIITGAENTLFSSLSKDVENLARSFAQQISKDKIFSPTKGKTISKEIEQNYQNVNLESIEQVESRQIGGEWLVKQAFNKLGLTNILESIGLDHKQVDTTLALLTAKLIHPSSELETERWLNENSGALELYDNIDTVSRYKLYQVTSSTFKSKQLVDDSLYNNVKNLFSDRNKIVIYDLTNMYFEGQMSGSQMAEFGRSKQKRNDRRLIGLALSIDCLGFVRHSQFYTGNVSEPETFCDLIQSVSKQLCIEGEKPLVVMDAGISTEDNLALLRSDKYNYDYVCVSRTVPKEYNKLSDNAEKITDNRGHGIELTKVAIEGKDDYFLHVKSDQKMIKEESMDRKMTMKLEAQLMDIKQKLAKKGTLKKINKVHEKVGAIKSKLSRIGWLYNISYTEDADKGIVTDITWERVKEREKPKGEYFLRYTKQAITENKIWDAYNLTRDVEAVFRCLKTDLDIRPIYHQKDEYIEPHIWLGILAYQVVNYIRRNLKQQNIHYSWSTIVEKMQSMQSSLVTVNNDNNEKVYIKLCTRPSKDQQDIFDALNFKHRPYVRKLKVVTQM